MAIIALFFGLAATYPAPDVSNPFLTVRVIRPGQSAIATDVSKQNVNVKTAGLVGDRETYEPFKDHVPPFLALPPVKGKAAYQTTHYLEREKYQ